MYILFESDVLYSILQYVNLQTVGRIAILNKCINKLCDTEHFWKSRCIRDYKILKHKGGSWISGYKHMHSSHKIATRFVKLFATNIGYIGIHKNVNIRDLKWLPPHMLKYIDDNKLSNDSMIDLLRFKINNGHDNYSKKYEFVMAFYRYGEESIGQCITRKEFINCIMRLYYDYPSVIFKDHTGTTF